MNPRLSGKNPVSKHGLKLSFILVLSLTAPTSLKWHLAFGFKNIITQIVGTGTA
jgi:hypothetical protein